jgi:drug/metabolite transporter superfamily protein YnfA
MNQSGLGWWIAIFFVAACFEVLGNVVIQIGYKQHAMWFGMIGFLILGAYGVVLNWVNRSETTSWTISKMLGVYVFFFTLVSIGWDLFLDVVKPQLERRVPNRYLMGLAIIAVGSGVIQGLSWFKQLASTVFKSK